MSSRQRRNKRLNFNPDDNCSSPKEIISGKKVSPDGTPSPCSDTRPVTDLGSRVTGYESRPRLTSIIPRKASFLLALLNKPQKHEDHHCSHRLFAGSD